MTNTLTMYDQAYPTAPAGYDVAAGYLGGDTPHVWTRAEWATAHARYRLPIWTRSNPGSVAASLDAADALRALDALDAPAGCLVALDIETAVSPEWMSTFFAAMHAGGHPVILYGSSGTVRWNPAPAGGYWVADPTGVEHQAPGAAATQWAFGDAYDRSVISSDLPLWDTEADDMTPAQSQMLEEAHAAVTGRGVASWGYRHTVDGRNVEPAGAVDMHQVVVNIANTVSKLAATVDALAAKVDTLAK